MFVGIFVDVVNVMAIKMGVRGKGKRLTRTRASKTKNCSNSGDRLTVRRPIERVYAVSSGVIW